MSGNLEINFFDQFHLGEGKPEKGKILISEPFSEDSYFARSVVLIADHNNEGTFGFIQNLKTDLVLEKVLPDFPKIESEIFFGGPVERDKLFYIHTYGEKLKGSEHIFDNLFWGGDFEQLKTLIEAKEITPNNIKFFAGYSGWGSGQLKEELDRKSWIIASTSVNFILAPKPENMWKTAVKRLGKDFELMANFPENPSLN